MWPETHNYSIDWDGLYPLFFNCVLEKVIQKQWDKKYRITSTQLTGTTNIKADCQTWADDNIAIVTRNISTAKEKN